MNDRKKKKADADHSHIISVVVERLSAVFARQAQQIFKVSRTSCVTFSPDEKKKKPKKQANNNVLMYQCYFLIPPPTRSEIDICSQTICRNERDAHHRNAGEREETDKKENASSGQMRTHPQPERSRRRRPFPGATVAAYAVEPAALLWIPLGARRIQL